MTDTQLAQLAQLVEVPAETSRSQLWALFLKQHCKKSLLEVQREYPFTRSLYIDYKALERWGKPGIMLADEMIGNPAKTYDEVYDSVITNNLIRPKEPLKTLHVRFVNLPGIIRIRDIRANRVNTFITLDGMITRCSEVRPRLLEAVFRCPGGHFTHLHQKIGKFSEPSVCSTSGCQYKKLDLMPKQSKYLDSQTGRIQENTDGLQPGEQPQYLSFDIEDDLVGRIVPGERVILNGILRSHQRIVRGEKSSVFDLFLEVNSIERDQRNYGEITITDEEEKEILRLAKTSNILTTLSQSILPAISGLNEEKKGLTLALFSPHQESTESGKKLRGSINIMMGGDPGISKTTILLMLKDLTPRAVYISGKSTSAAGLTFSMRQDDYDKRWVADAGAAVLADGSNLFLDELALMDKGDIMALNEFMESQILVVAKAGLNATLQARCSVIVALNPRLGRFDINVPLADQIDPKIPPQLLSRFDLIYLIPDIPSEEQDRKEANEILGLWCGETSTRDNQIPSQLLQKYIALAKRRKNPKINSASKREIVERFVSIRKGSNNNNITVTKRMLETLARLATAHAILRFGDEVTVHDAEVAMKVLEYSLKQISYDLSSGKFDADKVTGMPKGKRDMIKTIKRIVTDEPRLSADLLKAKMSEAGYNSWEPIKDCLDLMLRNGELMEPKTEHYQVV